MTPTLRLHAGLSGSSRVQRFLRTDDAVSSAEWLALIGIGISAAVISTLANLHLRVPGHAILKVVFPVAAGLAFVPRRGAGSVVSASAIVTAVSLRLLGFGSGSLGFGALTSLAIIGPMLDWALRHAQSHRAVYWGFLIAGLVTNLSALFVRGSLKGLGLERVGSRPLMVWLSQAAVTYTLCGIAAGLLSAGVRFCARPQASSNEDEPMP